MRGLRLLRWGGAVTESHPRKACLCWASREAQKPPEGVGVKQKGQPGTGRVGRRQEHQDSISMAWPSSLLAKQQSVSQQSQLTLVLAVRATPLSLSTVLMLGTEGAKERGRVNPLPVKPPWGRRRKGLGAHQEERSFWTVGGPGRPSAHLSSVSFFAMGQGLLRMWVMSFFFSSTCSRILASSSSDRDSPAEALEAKEGDLEESQDRAESEKEAHVGSEEPIVRQMGYAPDTHSSDHPSRPAPAQNPSVTPASCRRGR